MPSMSRQQLSDLYFMEARSKVIDVAAFLDRMDRGTGAEDFRVQSLRKTLKVLLSDRSDRAAEVLRSLSDPTPDPIPSATTKAACGAWPGPGKKAAKKKTAVRAKK